MSILTRSFCLIKFPLVCSLFPSSHRHRSCRFSAGSLLLRCDVECRSQFCSQFHFFFNFQMQFDILVPFSLWTLKPLTWPYHLILKSLPVLPTYCFISFFVVTVALQITFSVRHLFLSGHRFLFLQLQSDFSVSEFFLSSFSLLCKVFLLCP